MARKRSIIKAYKRKWKRMPKKDRVFVMKFLGTSFLILILILALLGFAVFRIAHLVDTKTSSRQSRKISSEAAPKKKSSSEKSASPEKKSSSEKSASSEKTSSSEKKSSSEKTDAEKAQAGTDQPEDSADAYKTLSDNPEVQLLARLIYAETGSSSDQAQIAVASVVMNRVNSDIFPDTISEVIYQRGQYSPTWNGSINNTPDEQALRNASYVYQNGSQIPSNVLFQARYAQGSGVWAHIDGNYFCYK